MVKSSSQSIPRWLSRQLKLADIDGHENLDDLFWFYEQLNSKYLTILGKPIPLPTEKDLKDKTIS